MNTSDRGIRDLPPILPEAPIPAPEAVDWPPDPAIQAMTGPPLQANLGPLARLGDATGGMERPQAPEPDAGSAGPPSTAIEEVDAAGTWSPTVVEVFTAPEDGTDATAKAADGNARSRDAAGSAERDDSEPGGPRGGGPEKVGTEVSREDHADSPDRAGTNPAPGDIPDALVKQEVGIDQTVALALWIGCGSTDVAIVQDVTVDQDADIDIDADGLAVPHSADLAVDGDMDFSIRQDARVDITGWDGRVITRITLDQHIALDQDFAVTVFVGADGKYDVKVDQGLLVDQDLSVSIALTEEDGTLFVDMMVVDRVLIDQDTSVLVNDDGDGESEAAIVQDVEVAQDVFISLDVEDGLDDLYDVSLSLLVRQSADVDQDAEIRYPMGEDGAEIGVGADQAAELDQEIDVYLDFAVT